MAAQPDPTPPEMSTEPEVATDADAATEPPAPMNRAERRAAARGGAPAQKIHGPGAGQAVLPPSRKRNYAARKSG